MISVLPTLVRLNQRVKNDGIRLQNVLRTPIEVQERAVLLGLRGCFQVQGFEQSADRRPRNLFRTKECGRESMTGLLCFSMSVGAADPTTIIGRSALTLGNCEVVLP